MDRENTTFMHEEYLDESFELDIRCGIVNENDAVVSDVPITWTLIGGPWGC